MQATSKLIPLLAFSFALCACSAKVSSSDIVPTGGAEKPFNNDIQGPTVDGHWTSDCEIDRLGQGSHVLTLTIQGQNVHWKDAHFNDDECLQAASTDESDGQMRYVKLMHDDVYDVEFKLRYPKYSFLFARTLEFKNGQLWLSDFENVDPTVALNPSRP